MLQQNQFDIRPSRWLAGFWLLSYGLVVLVIIVISWDYPWFLPSLPFYGGMAWYVYNRHIRLKHSNSVVWLCVDRNGWRLGMQNGTIIAVDLVRFVSHPWFICLVFNNTWNGSTLTLFPDSLEEGKHRVLRVQLK